MLDITLSSIASQQIEAGKNLFVPLTSTDTTNGADISYTVTSSNPEVTATVLTGNPDLEMTVSGTDANGNPFSGVLTFQLFEDYAPNTVAQIESLVNSGFYNGLTFQRVINNFVAQGGDPTGTGNGGSGTTFDDEFNTNLTYNSQGLLAMANSGHDANSSQFFITDTKSSAPLPENLNFENPIFGILTSGFDTFQKLITTPTNSSDRPINTATMTNVQMFTDNDNGVLQISAPAGFTGTSTITVKANDGSSPQVQQVFTTTVVPNTATDRPFLGPVSSPVTTTENTPVSFTVNGIDLENNPLTFVVKDANGFDSTAGDNPDGTGNAPTDVAVSIQVTPASGSTPASALVTLTPNANFVGTETLVIGVRDQLNRPLPNDPNTVLDSLTNFDTQKFTFTVTAGTDVTPTANDGNTTTFSDEPASIQLSATNGVPGSTQTLTYAIATQPQNGTISNFNANTGSLIYTPNPGSNGPDTFTFTVSDNSSSSGTLTSAPATFTVNVTPLPSTVTDINPPGVKNPRNYTVVSSTLAFFVAQDANGNGLYETNGTAAGTTLVMDFPKGRTHAITGLTNVNGTLFFVANDGKHGTELWSSNGTAAGTTMVDDVAPGTASSFPTSLVNVNGTLFFTASDVAHGRELWVTNGTAAGTTMLGDIRSGSLTSKPANLTNVNGTLFFTANDGTHGDELWTSNGTAAGTVMVDDIRSGVGSSNPVQLTNVNGTLFFTALSAGDRELWTSNGTSAGTVMVKNFPMSGKASHLTQLTNVNGTLFFVTQDDGDGSELWTSNGTAAGTMVLKDFTGHSGFSGHTLSQLTAVNGTLFFAANTPDNGTELWESNGTAAGTTLVKDINSGRRSSNPLNLTNIAGTLYFQANDGTDGAELWKSDGTAAGTVMVQDLLPGRQGSKPAYITNFGGQVLFTGDSGSGPQVQIL